MEGISIFDHESKVFDFFEGVKILINYIREREWLYRSLRTFFQTFISTLASLLVLNGENGFDRQILFSVSVSSVAAGISAVMNLNTKDGEKIE